MTAMQEMLMQTDGERILLAPRMAGRLELSFKLCAPDQTACQRPRRRWKVLVDTVTPRPAGWTSTFSRSPTTNPRWKNQQPPFPRPTARPNGCSGASRRKNFLATSFFF